LLKRFGELFRLSLFFNIIFNFISTYHSDVWFLATSFIGVVPEIVMAVMRKRILVLSLGYWFSAYTLGLLLHPYKTVRELSRRPAFAQMVWAPGVIWLMAWVVALVGVRLGGGLLRLGGMETAPAWLVGGLAFIFWWLSVFLGLWQVMVGYLWWRFTSVFKTE